MPDPAPTTPPPTIAADARPLGLSVARFCASMLGGVALLFALVAAVVFLVDRPDAWRGFVAAGLGSLLSLAVSLAVVVPLFARPTATLMYGFLVAGVVRAAVLGTIVVVAIRTGGYPENATLALAAALYAGIVTIEGLVLWHATSGAAIKSSPSLSPEHA